jgi:hypothetical protein
LNNFKIRENIPLLDLPLPFLPAPNARVDRPLRVLAVPIFVLVLALIPLLLMFIPDLPPIRAVGLDTLTPLLVIRTRGLLTLNRLFFLGISVPFKNKFLHINNNNHLHASLMKLF